MATEINRTFATRIDIPEAVRHKVVQLLNSRLADAFHLYSRLKRPQGQSADESGPGLSLAS
jgi:hypothetical protein